MSNPGSLLRFLRRFALPGGDEAEDSQLLARFAYGRDDAAFSALVARHGPMVLGVCRRLLRREQDAEDAFQATFLVLARKAGSLGRPEAVANWLYGVAYRTALEARARAAKRQTRERELTEEPAVDPSNTDVGDDLRAVLDSEINRLPDKYRSALVLCHLEGRTNEEAARLLHCPKGTILSRLATARKRLRDRLARRGVALGTGAGAVFTAEALSAAVPAELARATVSSLRHFVSGQAVEAASALALAKGVLHSMLLDRCKRASAVLLVLALLGGGLVWLGQPTWATDPQPPENPAAGARPGMTLEALLALETRVWEAIKQRDVATLRKLCAADFLAIHSDGSRLALDEFLAWLPDVEIKSYTLKDTRLIPLGPDAAMLVYLAETRTVFLGWAEEGRTQVSTTWVRRNREWRNVFSQETTVEE
jgi:RNA polymerase sigma factor (sigma-70 family)